MKNALDILFSLSESIEHVLDSACETAGMKPMHLRVLRLLADKQRAYTLTKLSDQCNVPTMRIMRVIDTLEKMGMVMRQRSNDDKRASTIHITEPGEASYNSVLWIVQLFIEEAVIQGMHKESAQGLITQMEPIAECLSKSVREIRR